MGNKATKGQMKQRVTEVYKLLLMGVDRSEILQHAANNWDLSQRSADGLIARANRRFEEKANIVQDAEFGKALTRLHDLYMRSMKVQDYKTCLSVQREIHSLLGLAKPATVKLLIDDLRSQAIQDIRNGKLTYEALAAEDQSLADELFSSAGVPIKAGSRPAE